MIDRCVKWRVLHILRNPFGFSEDVVRDARLDAADMIEALDGPPDPRHHYPCMRSDCLQASPAKWCFR